MENFLNLFPQFQRRLNELTDEQKNHLIRSFHAIPHTNWLIINQLLDSKSTPTPHSFEKWDCPSCFSLKEHQSKRWEEAVQTGEQYLRQNKLAAVMVAGGLGTRLGTQTPKGLTAITPLKKKPLFQVFAEKLRAIEQRYGIRLHWFIMTSDETYAATQEAFQSEHWYDPDYVHLFKQGRLPLFDLEGACLLNNDGSIRQTPNGHGGLFKALASSGCLNCMRQYGIETVSYFQVDNPLVSIADRGFLGLHLQQASDFSTKVVVKKDPNERVGVFVETEHGLKLIEYHEMPSDLVQQRDANDQLYFCYGNTAIHLIQRTFLEKMSQKDMPIHVVNKQCGAWDFTEHQFVKDKRAQKLEQFIFDALPFAHHPLLMEVDRQEEFSPVKNICGNDSIDTCQKDQIRRWKRWFTQYREQNPIDLSAEKIDNNGVLEISPLFADDYIEFAQRWEHLTVKPNSLDNFYLE